MIAKRPKSPRGFSLIELGIVIAAIAVLSTVVLLGSGFMNAAKARNAMELISTLRQAAKQFAARNNNGVTYYDTKASPPDKHKLSLKSLGKENLVPDPLLSPWGTGVAIEPDQSTDASKCRDYTCMKICVATPEEDGCVTCDDIRKQFSGNSIQATCGSGCGLGGACVLVLISR
ncbi:MAG TPA: type II secretion system protein [Myxococcales bacterium]|jgi:prepilin-type N-terminal cleavage/methylation domain-containing protein